MSASLKPTVSLTNLHPSMTHAIMIATLLYERHRAPCVITSAHDSRHRANSLHYAGRAIDLRTHNVLPSSLPALHAALVRALGDEYDVLLEADHIHIEYDPHPRNDLGESNA